jgi:UDPglucose--hexose-1-phosphate uridylyltransferase
MLAVAARHTERTGRNLGADILAAERAAGERVVTANEHWTAYVPAAARWPFEVHVVPHRHVLDLPDLSTSECDAFAPLYLDVLRRFEGLCASSNDSGTPSPYISAWHQAPVRHPDRGLAHLHLQLTSPQRAPNRLKYLAGSESAMGAFINDVRPEEAARRLREAGGPG